MIEDGTLVYEEESRVLEWFRDFLESASSSFATSVYYFDKYCQRCVNDLIALPFKRVNKSDVKEQQLDSIYLDDMAKFKNGCLYRTVLGLLKNNKKFLNDALKHGLIDDRIAKTIEGLSSERLAKMGKDEVALLMTDPDYLEYMDKSNVEEIVSGKRLGDEFVDESLVPLLKLHRLNNLQVKYAHTARVVYLTDLEVKQLGVEDELVKSILYTAALFHDVGRFYQGAFYNSYDDPILRTTEGAIKSGNVARDHAEAGYYYSLLDMINLNVLGVARNEDLIIHALAAVVVKNHQLPNSELGNYDKAISDFNFSDSIHQGLLDFVLNCYSKADKFKGGLHGRFDNTVPGNAEMMRNSFTDSMLGVLSGFATPEQLPAARKIIYELFNYEAPSLVLDADSITILRQTLIGDELANLEEKMASGESILLSPRYNEIIRQHRFSSLLGHKELDGSVLKAFFSKLISASESSDYYSQYDIVDIIDKVFGANAKGETYKGIELSEDVAKVLRMSMGLVMDMDKLDILVQRAIKRYPSWKPDVITIKALQAGDDASVVKDESLVDVLQNHFKINVAFDDNGKIILDEVLIGIIKHNADTNDSFKKKCGEDFDFSKLKIGMVVDGELSDALTQSYGGANVKVPYDIMAVAHSDLAERYKIELDLILPPDLRDNIFREHKDRRMGKNLNGTESMFPRSNDCTEVKNFQWGNSFPAVWWQLDQFVTTNMRSMESLRFIKNTGLLDRIGDAYKSEELPEEFGMFVDEIIDFSKEFIDLAITAKMNNNGDIVFDEENQQGYSSVVLSDDRVMTQIRDEAVRRRQARLAREAVEAKSSVSEYVTEQVDFQGMFDEPIRKPESNGNPTSELDSMFQENGGVAKKNGVPQNSEVANSSGSVKK